MRNRIRLWTEMPNGERVSHFSLHEFENGEGLVVLHPSVLRSLEGARAALSSDENEEVCIIITCGTRTEEDNAKLAEEFGWMDEGGTVSRTSKHLPRYGGVGVDVKAKYKTRRFRAYSGQTSQWIPQQQVGIVMRQFFDFVKGDYADGHVHCDNREGGRKV